MIVAKSLPVQSYLSQMRDRTTAIKGLVKGFLFGRVLIENGRLMCLNWTDRSQQMCTKIHKTVVMAQICTISFFLPQTPLGELTALPRPLSVIGEGLEPFGKREKKGKGKKRGEEGKEKEGKG